MLKRLVLAVVVIVVFVAVFTFTSRNTGTLVKLDFAFDVVELSVPVAVILIFAFGWLFGVITMGLYALKLVNERRGLRRSLRDTESEVSSLRNLPLSDAD
ncbi:MAG: LapA family protein [Pseudomonadota bacterium]